MIQPSLTVIYLLLMTTLLAAAAPAASLKPKIGVVSTTTKAAKVSGSPASTAPGVIPGTYFDRVVIFFFENQNYATIMKEGKFFNTLPKTYNGVSLNGYYGIQHNSQPNYIAITSGQSGPNGDDNENLSYDNIVDRLEKKGISWKTYQEDYKPGKSGACFLDDSGEYARKHNPFVSYKDIQSSNKRCANVVPDTQLAKDISSGKVPQYVFFTPNLKNDGHDTDAKYADNYFSKTFPSLMKEENFTKNTLFVVTWDEDDGGGDNQVACFMFGKDMKFKQTGSIKGTSSKKKSKRSETGHGKWNHYSTLHMVLDNWGLPGLKSDADSSIAVPLDLLNPIR